MIKYIHIHFIHIYIYYFLLSASLKIQSICRHIKRTNIYNILNYKKSILTRIYQQVFCNECNWPETWRQPRDVMLLKIANASRVAVYPESSALSASLSPDFFERIYGNSRILMQAVPRRFCMWPARCIIKRFRSFCRAIRREQAQPRVPISATGRIFGLSLDFSATTSPTSFPLRTLFNVDSPKIANGS